MWSLPCNGSASVSRAVPYVLFPNASIDGGAGSMVPVLWLGTFDERTRLWVHVGLLVAGLLLAVGVLVGSCVKPLPYGKLEETMADNGKRLLMVPTRLAYVVCQFVPGTLVFTVGYFIAGEARLEPANLFMYSLFLLHYAYRCLARPLYARYSCPKIPLWVPVYWTAVYTLYHYTNAEFIGSALYCRGYAYDPRFLLGLALFCAGFLLHCVSDSWLVSFRPSRRDTLHVAPEGCAFFLVSCPNYLGECIEWLGWAVMTWSLAGVVWLLFVMASLVPRARHYHKWYQNQFPDYPTIRTALVPFVY